MVKNCDKDLGSKETLVSRKREEGRYQNDRNRSISKKIAIGGIET